MLCILDGWGHRTEPDGNAILRARTPVLDRLRETGQSGLLEASGPAVGLPAGQMGNSEVGHMSIGAGRSIVQDLPRIDEAVANGALAEHPKIAELVEATRRAGGVCHVLGLLSPGGVHSHQDHIRALCSILTRQGVGVRVHAFLDGRDVPPRSAPEHLRVFLDSIRMFPGVAVATVSGRYWAMDRDRRWERTERAWRAVARGDGIPFGTAEEAVSSKSLNRAGDEFVEPAVIGDYRGIRDGDSLVFANFRADRARQILSAMIDPAFDSFPVDHYRWASCLTLAPCSSVLEKLARPLFPAIEPEHTLGETVARAGLRQLRVAETEKYAHVTYFLNGGQEEPFDGEDRILVPSPKVATYDSQPEMAAAEVTMRLVNALSAGRFDIAVVNYANADMVGHTGDLGAAVAAVEAVDSCLGRLANALIGVGGSLLLTADHGNAEQMGTPDNPLTAHTTNPVPLLFHDGTGSGPALPRGTLADLAPTALRLLGLEVPAVMRGTPLVDVVPRAR